MIYVDKSQQRAIGHAKIRILPASNRDTTFDVSLFDTLETTRLEQSRQSSSLLRILAVPIASAQQVRALGNHIGRDEELAKTG